MGDYLIVPLSEKSTTHEVQALLLSKGGTHSTHPANNLAPLYPALLRISAAALRRVGGNVQAAEDLVQESLCRWLENGAVYTNKHQAEAWLNTCIQNLAYDQRRRGDPLDHDPASIDQIMDAYNRRLEAEEHSI